MPREALTDMGFYPPANLEHIDLERAEDVEDEGDVIEEETSRMLRSKMWYRGNVL